MAIEVFNRYETKFLLERKSYNKIIDVIDDYMIADKYSKNNGYYTISNIYYDTYDNNLIRRSIEKPEYKEKIRLRAYGVPKKNDMCYLEIKKKFNGIVNKRRTSILAGEAYEFIKTGKIPKLKSYMNKQVLNELEYAINMYNVVPKVYIAYDRKAYFSEKDEGLRITFDENIRTRRYDLKLEAGDYGELLQRQGNVLLEVKSGESIPLWLSGLLNEYEIYKTSFSKYGREYNNMLMNLIYRSVKRYA